MMAIADAVGQPGAGARPADLGTRVTIAIVPRERFGFAVRSLQSVLDHTDEAVPIVYVDGRSPADVVRFVQAQAGKRRLRHVRHDRYLAPNEARNIALRHVDTEYVAFVDNDLIVQPGWLEKLVRCADETGAWLVGPLYLEGRASERRIHMLGGFARIEAEGARRFLVEGHFHPQEQVSELPDPPRRGPTELLEFHCMLARTEVFRSVGVLDVGLLSVHEHVDLCLNVRAAGGTIAFEPDAEVCYSFEGRLRLSDLPYIALRWGDEWTEETLAAFKKKWNLCDDDPSIAGAIRYCRNHRLMLLGQYLPRRLRQSRAGNRAVRMLDRVAHAVGRLRYGRTLPEESGAMNPIDPNLVMVTRPRHPEA